MAREIPAKEFKEAIKALNGLLKEEGEDTIKMVGVKKVDVIENFTTIILGFIEEDKSDKLPDNVIDFYNEYIVADESEEGEDSEDSEEEAEETEDAGKKKSTKKTTKKSTKKTTKKPPKKAAGPKVGYEIIRAIVENDNCLDREKVLDEVAKVFPDRPKDGMKTTVNHVVGVMSNYFKYLKESK